MVTTPTPITALPTPPVLSDISTFSTRTDAFINALPNFTTENNNLASNVYNNALEAYNNANTAISQATIATAAAASATTATNVVKWVSGTTYVDGANVWSPITYLTYRRIGTGAGTTDPSLVPSTYKCLVQFDPPVVLVSGTTYTASPGYMYVLTNVSTTTITLPTTPTSGDKVVIKSTNGLETNIINPNGNTIEGVNGNMKIDEAYTVVNLQYLNSSWRLV